MIVRRALYLACRFTASNPALGQDKISQSSYVATKGKPNLNDAVDSIDFHPLPLWQKNVGRGNSRFIQNKVPCSIPLLSISTRRM